MKKKEDLMLSLGTMRIASYEFEHIGDIEPVQDIDGSVRPFMPQDRYKNVRNLPLHRHSSGPFCKFKIANRFRVSGVYVLMVDEKVRYVGECVNLSARFNAGYGTISPKNCFAGGQETNCRLNHLVYMTTQAGERLSLWLFQTADHNSVEEKLRDTLNPPWNRA